MANNSEQKVGFRVIINGVEEYFDTLDKLKGKWKEISDELKEVKDRQDDLARNGAGKEWALGKDRENSLKADVDNIRKVIREAEAINNDYESVLNRLSTNSLRGLKTDLRAVKQSFNLVTSDDTERLKKFTDLMGQMNYKIREQEQAMRTAIMPAEELEKILSSLAKTEGELSNTEISTTAISKDLEVLQKLAAEYKNAAAESEAYYKKRSGFFGSLRTNSDTLDDLWDKEFDAERRFNDSFHEFIAQYQQTGTALDGLVEKYFEAVEARGTFVRTSGPHEDEWSKVEKESYKELEKALEQAKDAIVSFKGEAATPVNISSVETAVASTKQLKNAEEELKRQLNEGNLTEEQRTKISQDLAHVQVELANREKLVADAVHQSARAAKDAEIGYEGYDKVCKNLANASLAQLKRAQEDLNEAIQDVPRNTPEYEELAGKIRMVNQATKEAGQGFTEQVSAVDKAISRLKSYVLVYLSFNKVLDLVKSKFEDWKQLADSMSDIQKRTQLNPSTVRDIGEELNKIDTRTANIELYNLAATAGLLGLKSKEDIIGFTKVANEMSVALVELGEDGAAQLMKIATVTGDVKRYGVDGALTKVGSAINALTAASAASAGPIVDFISRVGAVGANCNVAMSEVAGLGATLDALQQPMELSATSMNKFIMAVKSNHRGIAATLGMDPDNLAALVEGGKTIEAVIQIIERMKETGTDVEEFLAEAGTGEGVRIKQTIMTLMDNTDMLRKQIEISNDEFRKGTSMANEYAVKNANSAAILARAYNNIQKAIINPDSEKTFKGIALIAEGLSYFVALIAKLLPQILGYVIGVRAQMEATSTATDKVNTKSKLWLGTLKLIKLAGKNILGGLIGTAVITGLEYLLKYLEDILKFLGLMKGRVGEVARSTAEWFNKLQTSIKQATTDADMMFKTLKKHISEGSTGTKEFADLVEQINSQYGQYINFTVTQTTSLEQLALAQEQVNNGIQRQMILESQRDRMSGIYANNAEEKNDAWAKIEQLLTTKQTQKNVFKTWTDKQGVKRFKYEDVTLGGIAKGAMPAVRDAITSSMSSIISDIQSGKLGINRAEDALKKKIKESFEKIGLSNGDAYAKSIISPAFKFMKKELEEKNALKEMNETVSASLGVANDKIKKGVVKQLQGIAAEYKKLLAEPQKNADRLMELQRNFGSVSAANLDNLSKTTKTWVSQQKAMMKQHEGEVRQYAKLVSIFGFNNMDPAGMSGDMLKKFSESLHKEWTRYAKNGDFKAFGEYIGQSFDSEKAANEWVDKTKDAIKARADELHITPPGGWKWDRKPRESHKVDKDETEAALANLDRYYEKLKTEIESLRAKEEITEAEALRRTEHIEQEHLERRAMLRKLFTEDINKSEQTLYQQWWSTQVQLGNLSTVKWDEIRKEWNKAEKDRREKNRLAWQKDYLEIEKITSKQKKLVREALLEYDPLKKLMNDIKDNLDKTSIREGDSLLDFGIVKEDMGDEEYANQVAGRFQFLWGIIKENYIKGAVDIKELMLKEGLFEWASMNNEEFELLFKRVDDFGKKYEEHIRQQAEKTKKLIQQSMKENGTSASREARMRDAESTKSSASLADSISYFGDSERFNGTTRTDDAEMQMLRLKMDLQMEYIKILYDQEKAELALAEAEGDVARQAEITAKYKLLYAEQTKEYAAANKEYTRQAIEDAAKVTQQLSPYADAMVEFADKFGGAVFGDKKDREAAAKELLVSVINTTSKMLTQWLIMVATKNVYNKMEKLQRQQVENEMLIEHAKTQAQMLGIDANMLITKLSLEKATTPAEISTDSAKGTGKEVAKHGLIGLAIGAAITIAMTALTSLITSRLTKSISDVQSISGVSGKKVAAGMLTYAEGNYPVLGSDGEVYDAKRVDKWQTKIYRSPHYGILGEKGPELIVDGVTTNKMMTQRPDLYQQILALAHGMTMQHARTYADGNYPAVPATPLPDYTAMQQQRDDALNAQLQANTEVMAMLAAQLQQGITIAPLGKSGAVNRLASAQKWMERHGL